jgi:hypothetical protein
MSIVKSGYFYVSGASQIAELFCEINNAKTAGRESRKVTRVYLIKVEGCWYVEAFWLASTEYKPARMAEFYGLNELSPDNGLSRAVFAVESNELTLMATQCVAFKNLKLVKEFLNI